METRVARDGVSSCGEGEGVSWLGMKDDTVATCEAKDMSRWVQHRTGETLRQTATPGPRAPFSPPPQTEPRSGHLQA